MSVNESVDYGVLLITVLGKSKKRKNLHLFGSEFRNIIWIRNTVS